jgi:predicted transcriptional regulator
MPDLNQHSLYELDILKQVEKESQLTNRKVAGKLGVSLKLAHEVLKRMVGKGLLHVKVVNSRRWDYFLTPHGIAEKTRLTMEFLDFSMHFYREARRRSSQVCRDLAEAGYREVRFLGAGDLAEIVYLGVQEWGLQLTQVYADTEKSTFMTLPVQPLSVLADHGLGSGDLELATPNSNPETTTDHSPLPIHQLPLLVCLYDASQPMMSRYLPDGIAETAGMHWVFEEKGEPREP